MSQNLWIHLKMSVREFAAPAHPFILELCSLSWFTKVFWSLTSAGGSVQVSHGYTKCNLRSRRYPEHLQRPARSNSGLLGDVTTSGSLLVSLCISNGTVIWTECFERFTDKCLILLDSQKGIRSPAGLTYLYFLIYLPFLLFVVLYSADTSSVNVFATEVKHTWQSSRSIRTTLSST